MEPPLPRWEAEAFESEPAHGYFVRLAARNGAHSTRVFADSVGLNGRDFELREMLSFCLRFPISNKERLCAATPTTEQTLLRLNGQQFRKMTDWSLRQPRVCAACLGEARYYRNWWDLRVLGRCPFHDRPLQSGTASSLLAWWYPAVGVTPQGHDLAIGNCRRAQEVRPSWDAYVLGRMGLTPAHPLPVLDECELHEAIGAAEFLGKVASFDMDRRPPRRISSNDHKRYQLICLGFSAFARGSSGVRELFERCLERRNGATASSHGPSPVDLYGWVLGAARNLPETVARDFILQTIGLLTHARGVEHRGIKKGSKLIGSGRIALAPLARELSMSKDRLRAIAGACNILRRESNKGRHHSFDPVEVAAIKDVLADLVSIKEARALLGVGRRRFAALRSSGAVVPFLNDGNANVVFRKSLLLS